MRLIVVSTPTGNCFQPEFAASLRRIPAAHELFPSRHSREEHLTFYRFVPDVEIRMGGCTFIGGRRKRDAPKIRFDGAGTGRRFMPKEYGGLPAATFLPGDELHIRLNPEAKERAVPNFWFLFWLHIAGCQSLTKERLYR